MLPQKPYAISCDRNSEPLLEKFKVLLQDKKSLLEVGSGTGQHAIFMAPYLKDMTWTLTDRRENFEGISLWMNDFPRINLRGPLEYELGQTDFPTGEFDVVFAANVLHIVSWELCLKLFGDLESVASGTDVLLYGAYKYDGKVTSESNEKFEKWLKNRDSKSGIRNFEDVNKELSSRGFTLIEDHEMPANNRLLQFRKI